MSRLHSRSGRGGGRSLWLGVATAAVLLAVAAPAQAAPFVYVTNGDSNNVSQYNVGAAGLLAPLSPPSVRVGVPTGVVVSPDGKSVYVASFDSGGVSQFDVGSDGTLTPKSPPRVATGPFLVAVVVSPDGKSVYGVNPGFPGRVYQFDVGPDGALTPKSPPRVGPVGAIPQDLVVSPDGKSVYVADPDPRVGGTPSVYQFDVGPGGKLSPKSPPFVEDEFHPFGVAVSPDSESVYAVDDLGVSQWDAGPGGALSPKSPPRVGVVRPGGNGVAASPDGKTLYVAGARSGDTNRGSVYQFDVGPDGALFPKSPPTVAAGDGSAAAVVSPGGKSVYVANYLSGDVSQYDVGRGGLLAPLSPPAVPAGDHPLDVAVSPVARVPTSKEQCKHGGWKQFGFKTQGQCIHFVKHGSKK